MYLFPCTRKVFILISTWTFNIGKAQTQTQQYQRIMAFWFPCYIYLLYSSNVFPSILTRWKSPMLSCFLTPFTFQAGSFLQVLKHLSKLFWCFPHFFIFIFPTLKRPLYIEKIYPLILITSPEPRMILSFSRLISLFLASK